MFKIIRNMDMVRQAMRDNEALRAENAALQAKLDYLAMMTEVDIEETKKAEEIGNE